MSADDSSNTLLTKANLLRIFLGYSSVGWGVCVIAIFAPADLNFQLLAGLGGLDITPLTRDPMFDYWLRMAAGAFTLIGIGYLILALFPRRFSSSLPFAGLFMLVEGLIILIHGLRLDLPPTPFYGDAGFSIVGGIGILATMNSVRRANK